MGRTLCDIPASIAFVIPQRHLSGKIPETLNLLVPVLHGGRYFYALKGGVCMSELLFFIIGTMLGGCIGIVTMCLFQINRLRGKDDDK
jgi:hypothetical protein